MAFLDQIYSLVGETNQHKIKLIYDNMIASFYNIYDINMDSIDLNLDTIKLSSRSKIDWDSKTNNLVKFNLMQQKKVKHFINMLKELGLKHYTIKDILKIIIDYNFMKAKTIMKPETIISRGSNWGKKLILYILKPDFYSYDIIKNVKIYIENIPIENKFKWNIIWKKLNNEQKKEWNNIFKDYPTDKKLEIHNFKTDEILLIRLLENHLDMDTF